MLIKSFSYRHRRFTSVFLVGVAGIIAAILFLQSLPPYYSLSPVSQVAYHDLSFWGGVPPQSLNDLVNKADLIVVGTVGTVVEEGTFRGYENGRMLRMKPTGDPNDHVVKYVDFEIQVEQVLLDDGTIASGKPVILRSSGIRQGAIDPDAMYPMPASGDRHLFFLTSTPDHTAYGHYYFSYSRLMINGPTVTLSDGPRTELKLNDVPSVAPGEFIRTVRELAQIKGRQGR